MNRFLLTCLILCGCAAVSVGRPPNVVVILTDDQGWGDLSLHGNTNLATPNLDALAAEGARFERFYVSPVCSPTRAEFLTGRYHPRGGVYSTSAGGERLDLDETTIAERFRAAGYATAAFGKWHNGMQYPYHPRGRGFDEFYGFCSGHWGDYFSPPLDHNGEWVRGEGYLTDDFTDRALAFMEAHREKPFFVYLPYNTPHSPMQVPDRWWETFRDRDLAMRHRDPDKENIEHTRAALAMCENIDWNVGRVTGKLSELGLREDTIVVYFCDNGPNGFRWNGGMKGRKGSTDEGGVRSPLFVRWPGHIPANHLVRTPAAAIDLLPTLTDLAGVPRDGGKALDGVSLRPLLLGEGATEAAATLAERPIFSHWNGRVSVRRGGHVLDHQGQLFDLGDDPGQDRDLADAQPELAAELGRLVSDWRRDVLTEDDRDRARPFPIGHPEFRHTQLPARDGVTEGGIRRSNRFPNCSYFTNWKTIDDRITWPVEVAHAGRYEVTLHYTCPEGSTGSTVELSFREARLRATIEEAHDPPVRGAEHDRVERVESYVKDFRAMRLGVIDLPAGTGSLVLRAVEVPGEEVMDLRLLKFTRLD